MKNWLKNNWVLLCILGLAFFFRFWQISHLPGGLFPDEAANGLDINLMRHGQIQPFYERGNGREALFFYFEWLSAALFGTGAWQFHIVSAAFGFLSVLAVYFLAKMMFGKRVALLASFFLAVSSYAVDVSRTAFRANTVPLISALTILFLIKFFQSKEPKTKYWSAALAGLFFGLGFYTYTSFRMMIPLVFGFFVLLALAFRHKLHWMFVEFTKYKLVFFATFLATVSWIASYFFHHPGSFVGRSGQVSVFNPELNHGDLIGTIISVFKATILSFFTQGDLNWRHNISGFPFLTPLISPFFAVAVVICTIAGIQLVKEIWQKSIQPTTFYKALLACWFWFMLVPEISTAEGIPHGLRLTGVIPPLFILSAWGVNWAWERMPHHRDMKIQKYLIVATFFLTILVYNFALYFGIAAASEDYYYFFRSDLTTVSDYLNQRNTKNRTYLSLDTFSVQTVEYLTTDTNQPYVLVDPAHTYEVKLKKGDEVIFTQSTIYDRIKFMKTHPKAKLINQSRNEFGQLIMLVYEEK